MLLRQYLYVYQYRRSSMSRLRISGTAWTRFGFRKLRFLDESDRPATLLALDRLCDLDADIAIDAFKKNSGQQGHDARLTRPRLHALRFPRPRMRRPALRCRSGIARRSTIAGRAAGVGARGAGRIGTANPRRFSQRCDGRCGAAPRPRRGPLKNISRNPRQKQRPRPHCAGAFHVAAPEGSTAGCCGRGCRRPVYLWRACGR